MGEQALPRDAASVVLVRPAYSAVIYGATYRSRLRPGTRQVPTPLQLMQIGGVLDARGHRVRIIDGEAEGLSDTELVRRVLAERPDVVGVTCTTPEFGTAKAVLEALKRARPDVVTVVGGAHATHVPWELATGIDGIDHVVVFEGERAMAAVVDGDRALLAEYAANATALMAEAGVPEGAVPDGVVLLGEMFTTEELERLRPLRRAPQIDLSHYVYSDPESGLVATDSVETARGCPFGCTFCSSARSGLGLRSVAGVIDELDRLDHAFRARGARGFVVFLDDTLTASRPRAVQLFEEMERRRFRMRYSGFTRANTIATNAGRAEDLEFASLMKRVGFNTMSFGIETGSDRINAAMNKGVTKDHYRRAYDILSAVDFEERRGSFIVGHPHETAATIRESIDFAKELRLHRVGVNIMTPYPGTAVYDAARLGRGLYFEPEAGAYDQFRRWGRSVVSTDALSREALEYWHRRFLAEVYTSSAPVRHGARELARGNVSRFYHRPVTSALRSRIGLVASRRWSRPPTFPVPDHRDYDPSAHGRAHLTKNDCLAFLRRRYDVRSTRVRGSRVRIPVRVGPQGLEP